MSSYSNIAILFARKRAPTATSQLHSLASELLQQHRNFIRSQASSYNGL